MSANALTEDSPAPGHDSPESQPPASPAGGPPPNSTPSVPAAYASGTAWLGAAAVLALLLGAFPPCVVKLAVGAPCPGCGLTRATLALLRLDFAEVWRLHPLAPVVSPLVGWLLLRPLAVNLGLLPRSAGWLRGRALVVVIVMAVAATWVVYAARLAGALGGHPDPVSLGDGWLTRWWF
jgi:hypothetical protein